MHRNYFAFIGEFVFTSMKIIIHLTEENEQNLFFFSGAAIRNRVVPITQVDLILFKGRAHNYDFLVDFFPPVNLSLFFSFPIMGLVGMIHFYSVFVSSLHFGLGGVHLCFRYSTSFSPAAIIPHFYS